MTTPLNITSLRVKEIIEAYLQYMEREKGISPTSREWYWTRYNVFLEWLNGYRDGGSEIESKDIQGFISDLEEKPPTIGVTVRAYYRALKVLFDWATGEGIIMENPMVGVPEPREPQEPKETLATVENPDPLAILPTESVDQFLNTLDMGDFEEIPQDVASRKLSREELMERVKTQGIDSVTRTDMSGYDHKEPADPNLVEFALDNIGGFEDSYKRRITKHHIIGLINELKDNRKPPYIMGDVDNDICMFSSGYDAGRIATVKESQGITQAEMEADTYSANVLERGGATEKYPGQLRQMFYWDRLFHNVKRGDIPSLDELDKSGLSTCVEVAVKTSTPYGLAEKMFHLGIAYQRDRGNNDNTPTGKGAI
ncbi:MAG: phage integrase N-terminal SAM-like domain-containing protein [Chloroflexi bacterium]|nr:phage integrase N-terminal SAM-like domain-containing protein [Chloroflexota bacterium]